MNLRRKLLVSFSALGLVALFIAGVTGWAVARWETSTERLEGHYQRSLLLQRVRSTAFRAFKEVPDAINAGDPQARREFEALLEPAEADFQQWADLADTDEERRQVVDVRRAFDQLITDARHTFDLVDAGRTAEAATFMEDVLEAKDFIPFQEITEAAVASDRAKRDDIRRESRDIRRTAQVALVVAAFGAVSLILLLAAYLAADLFRPLRLLQEALDAAARGDRRQRLDEDRDDELGTINRAFNQLIDVVAQREQAAGLATLPNAADAANGVGAEWQQPSRVLLHRLVDQLRAQVMRLQERELTKAEGVAADASEQLEQQTVMARVDQLLEAVTRVSDFGFPLDLSLVRTDLRLLLYEVINRFQDEIVNRSISLELELAPDVTHAVVDRLKIREVLNELVRNALAALPDRGGRLGLRSTVNPERDELLLEVADDGHGFEASLIDELFTKNRTDGFVGTGLTLARAVLEQHGGRLKIQSRPGIGTNVQICLPLRHQPSPRPASAVH